MIRAVLIAVTGFWASAGIAQDALLSRCAAANPAFPALCPCAVEAGRAAGISEADLGALVSNNFLGVAPQAVAAWGPIFATCTAQAVNAGLGLPGAPQPQIAPQPQPQAQHGTQAQSTPAPIAPLPPLTLAPQTGNAAPTAPAQNAAPLAPLPPLQPLPALNAPAAAPRADLLRVIKSDPAQPPGTWGNLVLEKPGGASRAMIGTTSLEGTFLALACRSFIGPELAHMVIGPFADGPATAQGLIRVAGSGGYERGLPLQRLEGGYYAAALYAPMAEALMRGSETQINAPELGLRSFGLRGSSRAIRSQFSCGVQPRFWTARAHPQTMDITLEGRWQREELRVGRYTQPVLVFPSAYQVSAEVSFTCDGRIRFTPNVSPYRLPLPGAVEYVKDGVQMQHFFTFDIRENDYIGSEPLAPQILAEIAAAPRVSVTFNADFAEGADFGAIYTQVMATDGLAEGLTALSCPEIAPVSGPARMDLTQLGGRWQAADFGQMNGTTEPVPGAFFSLPASAPEAARAIPELLMYCGAAPFFVGGAFDLRAPIWMRFEASNAPGLVVETDFTWYRSLLHTSWRETDQIAPQVLAGGTLRVTALEARDWDALYPLDGLARALQEAGCPPGGGRL